MKGKIVSEKVRDDIGKTTYIKLKENDKTFIGQIEIAECFRADAIKAFTQEKNTGDLLAFDSACCCKILKA